MNLWRVTKSRTIFSSPNHNRLPRLLPAGRSSLKGIATWENKHQPSGPDEPADHPTHNVSPGPTEWRRPSDIPYQTKVANSVQLVGSIERPVEMVSSDDGTCSASTVLTHHRTGDLPYFRIPITFQGELAETAAFHLKENDLVYVTGKLSGEATPLSIDNAKTYVKVKPKFPDFTNRETGEGLWLNGAPEWVLEKVEGMVFEEENHELKEGKSGDSESLDLTLPVAFIISVDSEAWFDARKAPRKLHPLISTSWAILWFVMLKNLRSPRGVGRSRGGSPGKYPLNVKESPFNIQPR
ncbi:hypothetical protein QJS10_CPA02g01514 [Acorus calamus]|uniref:Uncharacterized protein n=1 Tax=Acorus calamus TaxID=4465 RepID=A0AAV9FGQ6_ACOCL|nr:hypothetical protein QJS10_CPA02g01514 [Acorus calamus]